MWQKLPICITDADKLPKVYTTVLPAAGFSKEPCVPVITGNLAGDGASLTNALERQHSWLNVVHHAVENLCCK